LGSDAGARGDVLDRPAELARKHKRGRGVLRSLEEAPDRGTLLLPSDELSRHGPESVDRAQRGLRAVHDGSNPPPLHRPSPMKGGVSAEVPTTLAPDDLEESAPPAGSQPLSAAIAGVFAWPGRRARRSSGAGTRSAATLAAARRGKAGTAAPAVGEYRVFAAAAGPTCLRVRAGIQDDSAPWLRLSGSISGLPSAALRRAARSRPERNRHPPFCLVNGREGGPCTALS
jgi:hypothetical protein